jgi:hypothetical protein
MTLNEKKEEIREALMRLFIDGRIIAIEDPFGEIKYQITDPIIKLDSNNELKIKEGVKRKIMEKEAIRNRVTRELLNELKGLQNWGEKCDCKISYITGFIICSSIEKWKDCRIRSVCLRCGGKKS